MKVIFDSELVKELSKLKKKDRRLLELAFKKIELFKLRPNHPSLRLHKLSGGKCELWSISINESIRMIFYYSSKDTMKFIDIGKHEEVYR